MPTEAERTRALTGSIVELAGNVAALAGRVDVLHDSVEADRAAVEDGNRRGIVKTRWSFGAAGLAVILSGLVLVGYVQQTRTSGRLETLVAQQTETTSRLEALIAQEQIWHNQVWCPLYQVLLGSYQPETRQPGSDRDKYERVFEQMRVQYAALQCAGDLVPPRSDLVLKPAH